MSEANKAIVKMIDISRASKQEKDDALKESQALLRCNTCMSSEAFCCLLGWQCLKISSLRWATELCEEVVAGKLTPRHEQVLSSLKHPYIVRYRESFHEDTRPA